MDRTMINVLLSVVNNMQMQWDRLLGYMGNTVLKTKLVQYRRMKLGI